jgi:hypothetical protein
LKQALLQKAISVIGLIAVHGAFVIMATRPSTKLTVGLVSQVNLVDVKIIRPPGAQKQALPLQATPTASQRVAANDTLRGGTHLQPLDSSIAAHSQFLPSYALERRPVPISEPDLNPLSNIATTGLPIQLRLFINRFGKVVEIQIRQAPAADTRFVDQVVERFRATAFIPGRREGIDVPSFMDIELRGYVN